MLLPLWDTVTRLGSSSTSGFAKGFASSSDCRSYLASIFPSRHSAIAIASFDAVMYVLELHPVRNTFSLECMHSTVESIEDVPTPRLALFDVDRRSIVLGRNPETCITNENLSRTVCEIIVHVGHMGLVMMDREFFGHLADARATVSSTSLVECTYVRSRKVREPVQP